MRWPAFFILAYLALGVQVGLSGVADIHGARLNVVLLAVVFIALDARREEALLACFLLGLMQDLLTLQPLGVWALAYGLVAMFIVSTQEMVYREHPLTHFSVTLGAGLLSGAAVWAHGWLYAMIHSGHLWTRPSALALFFSAIYTALVAPLGLWLLQRTRRLFGFHAPRLRPSRTGRQNV